MSDDVNRSAGSDSEYLVDGALSGAVEQESSRIAKGRLFESLTADGAGEEPGLNAGNVHRGSFHLFGTYDRPEQSFGGPATEPKAIDGALSPRAGIRH